LRLGVKTPKIKSNQFSLPTHPLRQFGHQGPDFIKPSIFIGATLNLYTCINMMINTNDTRIFGHPKRGKLSKILNIFFSSTSNGNDTLFLCSIIVQCRFSGYDD
jgi:hypothetical protein